MSLIFVQVDLLLTCRHAGNWTGSSRPNYAYNSCAIRISLLWYVSYDLSFKPSSPVSVSNLCFFVPLSRISFVYVYTFSPSSFLLFIHLLPFSFLLFFVQVSLLVEALISIMKVPSIYILSQTIFLPLYYRYSTLVVYCFEKLPLYC